MRVVLLLLALMGLAPAAARGQLSVEVNAALARAVQRVLDSQRADGSFGPLGARAGATAAYPMGSTALATYALRKAGVQPSHPALVAATRYLLTRPLEKTYSVSALAMAFHALDQPDLEAHILAAGEWLEAHQDERTGLWAYPNGEADLSNSQFAVLALKVAAHHGHELPSRVWADVIEGALAHQREDGGFFYRHNYWPQPSGTMTTAGLTTLYVALEFLEQSGQHRAQQELARDGIERGWDWLDARFSPTGGPMGHAGVIEDRYPEFGRSDEHHYYYLYGVERVASFADRETVGGLRWYSGIASEMLSYESPEGGWGSLENTCLALLVLRRATLSGGRSPPPDPLGGGAAGGKGSEDGEASATQPGVSSAASAAAPASAGGELWAYSTEEPDEKWLQARYDDSRWARGEGGFGGPGAAGLVVRTPWETADLWVRRRFQWTPAQGEPRLFVIHDDAVQIWINGVPAAKGGVWSGGRYKEYALSAEARRSLRTGENLLTAWVHDNGGGRSLDIRFTRPTEQHDRPASWQRSLPHADVPFIRRWQLLGPQDDEEHEALLELSLPTAVERGRKLGKRAWRTERTLGNRLWIHEATGGEPGTTSYLSAWLHAETGQEANLWLGVADGVRGWLDNEPLLVHHEHGAARPDELRVALTLRPGAQRLVLLVEQAGQQCPLFARVAGVGGEPIAGLRYALSAEAPDEAQMAVAQPDLFSLPELARTLPVAGTSQLRFDRQDDIGSVGFTGVTDEGPRWVGRTSDKLPAPRPPPGARGVLSLGPPSPGRPVRLFVRVVLGARAHTLSAEVALAEQASAGGQLRLVLVDAELHTVLETRVEPDVGGGRRVFQRVSADIAEFAGRNMLCLLEWSALPGQVPQPLFLDALEIR